MKRVVDGQNESEKKMREEMSRYISEIEQLSGKVRNFEEDSENNRRKLEDERRASADRIAQVLF